MENRYGYKTAIKSAGGGVIRLNGERDRLILIESRFKWVKSDGVWDDYARPW